MDVRRRFAVGLATAGAAAVLLAGSASAATTTDPGSPLRAVPFMRGASLGEWGVNGYDPAATARYLRKLKLQDHIDSVTLCMVWMQRNGRATSIAPGPSSIAMSNFVAAIRSARRLGLKVVIKPYVDLYDGTWRGDITPASIPAWFASYRRFIDRFATLAQKEKATGLVVGSELVRLSVQDAEWRKVVADARRRFKGFLTYQMNWNGETVNWFDAVDAVSVSAYYELAEGSLPSVEQLLEGWRYFAFGPGGDEHSIEQVQQLSATWKRPVFFGEIGYRTKADTAARPWDNTFPATAPDSDAAQRNAYEAALRTWYQVPWFRGFQWWYLSPGGRKTYEDYRPASMTLRTLASWYAKRRTAAPATFAPPPVPSP